MPSGTTVAVTLGSAAIWPENCGPVGVGVAVGVGLGVGVGVGVARLRPPPLLPPDGRVVVVVVMVVMLIVTSVVASIAVSGSPRSSLLSLTDTKTV